MVNFLYAPSEQETVALQYMQHKEAQMLYSKKDDLLKLGISSASCLGINSRMVAQGVQQQGTGLF